MHYCGRVLDGTPWEAVLCRGVPSTSGSCGTFRVFRCSSIPCLPAFRPCCLFSGRIAAALPNICGREYETQEDASLKCFGANTVATYFGGEAEQPLSRLTSFVVVACGVPVYFFMHLVLLRPCHVQILISKNSRLFRWGVHTTPYDWDVAFCFFVFFTAKNDPILFPTSLRRRFFPATWVHAVHYCVRREAPPA